MNNELRTVRLTGELGRRFGRIHRLVVDSPAEAIRALSVICPGFKQFLINSNEHKLQYRVRVGREVQSVEDLKMNRPASKSFTFAPVLMGGKKGGALQTIVGAVLVVVGVVVNAWSGGSLSWIGTPMIKFGVALMAGGVIQMLSSPPNPGSPNEADKNKPSTYFNGPVNTVQQGQPVPVGYGKLIIGSAQIGAGLNADKVAV
jgi:predicted phage tail protein